MQQDYTSTLFRFGSHGRLRVGVDHVFERMIRLSDIGVAGRKLGIVASLSSYSPRERLARDDEQVVLGRPFNVNKKHRSPAPARQSGNRQAAGASHRAIRRA